jgi:Ca2+-binding RTX toxin-like protein
MTTRVGILTHPGLDRTYRSDATNYLTSIDQSTLVNRRDYILQTAAALGVSAGAIAGGLAEEAHGYFGNQTLNDTLDRIALDEISLAGWPGNSTHEEWLADYDEHKDDLDHSPRNGFFGSIQEAVNKVSNPIFVDMGVGNFKIGIAIRLMQEYEQQYSLSDDPLGLIENGYHQDYAMLAADLANDRNGIQAKFWGLMIQEAQEWFEDKAQYMRPDYWESLPQEYKDALYITYANFGRDFMQSKFDALKPGEYYEPGQGRGTAGGIAHLANAGAIGGAMGIAGYGDAVFTIPAPDVLIDAAKDDSEIGVAFRYALVNLRHEVLTEMDYSLYTDQLRLENFSEQYLEDRARLLALSNFLDDKDEDNDSDYLPGYYEDKASGLVIDNGGDIGYLFAKENGAVDGAGREDHLYGSTGSELLSGFGGNDYLEGGAGDDDLYGDDGIDTAGYESSDDAVTVTLLTGQGRGGHAEGDWLYDIENLIGSRFDDLLEGGEAANRLDGGAGNDTLIGGGGGDALVGGEGDDTASYETSLASVSVNLGTGTATGGDAAGDAFDSIEHLTGSNFNDTLAGTGNGSVLTGLNGDDTYVVTHADDRVIEAENGGNDTIKIGVSHTLAEDQHIENLTLTGTDDIDGVGNNLDNRIQGNSGDNILQGMAGDDILLSPGGNNTLEGGKGNDILVTADSEAGLQTSSSNYIRGDWNVQEIRGGSGDDDLFAEKMFAAERTFVYGKGHGNDVLFVIGGYGTNQNGSGLAGTTILLEGLTRDDVEFFRPETFAQNEYAFELFQTTYGVKHFPVLMRIKETGETLFIPFSNYRDSLNNDSLWADWEFKFADGETLNAESLLTNEAIRDDQLILSYYWQAKYQRLEQAEQRVSGETQQIAGVYDSDFNYPFFPTAGEYLDAVNATGTTGNDRLSGSIIDDHLSGGAGDDLLMGAMGADTLRGGADNDRLFGDDGVDTIDGGSGDDLLGGGRDVDILTGGEGADRFVFSPGDGYDVITDAGSEDKILIYGTSAADDRVNLEDLYKDREGDDLHLIYGKNDRITLQGWFSGNRIGTVEVYAEESETPYFTLTADEVEALNHAPEITVEIPDQTAMEDDFFEYTIPAAAFIDHDPDDADQLLLSADLGAGQPLPEWLNFDPETGVLSGTPGNDDVN